MPEYEQADLAFPTRSLPPLAQEDQWHAPDGWRLRRLTIPPLPGVPCRGRLLFVPGRGDIFEKHLEFFAEMQARGWHVTSFDWRGQGGSGRLGLDATTGHIEDFSVWIDDLSAFWADWFRPGEGPHVLAGHSMGGHLALRAVAEHKVNPDALILSAPMLGFFAPGLPVWLQHVYACLMAKLGDSRRPAWKGGEKPGSTTALRMHLLTHDQRRHEDELWWRAQRPDLGTGAASWRWMERAVASRKALFAPGVLEGVTIPVLLISTSADHLVSHAAVLAAARRLPHAQLIALGRESRHEVLREVDAVRAPLLAAIHAFLDERAPQSLTQTLDAQV
ncbi:alpha/beta fold hydrolase [Novosphingobium terrae]|uniref:alpha/beta fold hydrolase n=1 Tax=Novosphingobium terrae TaxID=2726189 RepID=UPI001980FE70|nr:alpha/beta hydrolase [Novosphingobium terrae]